MSLNSQELLKQALHNLKKREEIFQTQQNRIQYLQVELDETLARVEQLQTTLNARTFELAELEAQLTAKEAQIERLQSSVSQRRDRPEKKVPLETAWGIDYSRLDRLLSEQQWQAANEETVKKMLEVMGRSQIGYLSEEHIRQFPCADFHTIDGLWVRYSQGRFGFSVQKTIFESLGYNPQRVDYDRFQVWVNRLGWVTSDPKSGWIGSYRFALTAPPGHLPEVASALYWKDAEFPVTKVIIRLRGQRALFSLLDKCENQSV